MSHYADKYNRSLKNVNTTHGPVEDYQEKMLPRYYLEQCERRNKHRVISDYIASMSDRYAMKLYNELYGREA